MPCLKPKLTRVTASLPAWPFHVARRERERLERLPQLMHRQVRRVDDVIGHRPDAVHPPALGLDPFRRRRVRRQRMRPPRFAEAPHERGVRRLEEDQRRVQPFHAPQLPVRLRELREKILFPDVHDDGDARDAFAPHEIGERRNERRRNVVDAEVAEILERPDRLRFPRARQAGQHDEPRLARRATPSARGPACGLDHGPPRCQAGRRFPTRRCRRARPAAADARACRPASSPHGARAPRSS